MSEVIIRKPNMELRLDSSMAMKVHKCPFLNCNEVFLDQDDRDAHRVYVHADIPKTQLEIIMPSGKLFDKRQIYAYQAQLQREALIHKVKALGALLAENRARAKLRADQRKAKRLELEAQKQSTPLQMQQESAQPAPKDNLFHKAIKWTKNNLSKK